ncbi:MAG: hypothetical protein ABJA34_13790 [Pseudonocardiales bacterium]
MISRATRLVAALTLAGAANLGYPAEPAAALAPTHVAIVVADIGTACVPWHSGMTGADVLNANFDVLYGSPPSYAGFVLKINDKGTTHPDLTHYWAYFHNAGGGWAYSGSGATGFHPQPGTVEGWAYDDGQNQPPNPPGTSYAAICGGQDPAPPPTPAPTQSPRPVPVTPHPTPPPTADPGQSAPSTAASSPSGSTASSGAPSRRSSTGHRSASSAGAPASRAQSTSGSSQGALQPVSAKQDPKHSSAGPAVGTALALLAAAGLGGTAFWRLRRQKHG